MGRKSGSLQVKRVAAPKIWPIARKEYKFAIRVMPGPHPKEQSIPLYIILKDILKLVRNRREAKRIVAEGQIKVDGRIRRDLRYPVGLMDVIELIKIQEYYRVLPLPNYKFMLHPISKEEATYKLCSIKDKVTIKGGHIQLALHDGRNQIVHVKDPRNPEEDVYHTRDSVKISIPDQKLLGHIEFKEGVQALIVFGKNMGHFGVIKSIRTIIGPVSNVAVIETPTGKLLETTTEYVFPVGYEKPEISLPEVITSE